MNLIKFFETCNVNSREVLKNLPDAVFVVELDGKISWVNNRAVRMFQCFEKDLVENYIDEVVINGMAIVEESFFKKKLIVTGAVAIDGSEFFVELNSKKYGEQYFITLRNVTQMTNVFSNVEKNGKLNKEKNVMLCKLENDFQSPLKSISGFSKALKDGLCGEVGEKQDKYLEIINKNAKELSNFVDKLINLSYVESTLFKLDCKFFDVITFMQNIIKGFEQDLKSKNLDIDFNFEDLHNKIIFSDERVLKSVMADLMEIAISLTSIGAVSIKLSNPELQEVENIGAVLFENSSEFSYIKFEIKDTGVGFTNSELKDLFNPYDLLETPNKKVLLRAIVFATVQKFVKRLKGEILITSEVMKGSVYTIILPIEKDKSFEDE